MGATTPILVLIALIFAIGPIAFPNATWHVLMVIDYMEPGGWKLFNDPYVEMYHNYLMSRLPEIPEQPAIVLPLKDATRESLRTASRGYTVPVIIRGAVDGVPAITKWTNRTWWMENYKDEPVLCKMVDGLKQGDAPSCTVGEAFNSYANDNGGRLYISGESKIFQRHPELLDDVTNSFLESIAPGKQVFTQIFLGYPGTGSDVHSAIGCNFFRMIAGRKKWWLMPPSQSAYVYGSINPNGFSAHTKTKIGKGTDTPSPWLNKIERYTIELEAGDLLLNTAWYWHGIDNLGDPKSDDMVIGVPTRYSVEKTVPAFKSNFLLSTIALAAITKTYGGIGTFTSNTNNLQDGIETARNSRVGQNLDEVLGD